MSDEPQLDEPKRTGGLDPKIGGLLAYLVGWVSGLVVLFTQTDREVRFHAAQSVVVFGGLHLFIILWTAVIGRSLGPGFVGRTLFTLFTLILYGLVTALWGFLCVQGYRRVGLRIPGAGNLAEWWLQRSGHRGRHAQ
ncbi:MAG: DUF4870 domain-containing protein [Egibacteraceae bacterium]